MTIRRGASRIVFLIGNYAIKFPRLHFCKECYPSCFSRFLFGLYGNAIEAARWKRDRDERMARVIFGCMFVVVMERCGEVVDVPREMLGTFDGIVARSERPPQNFGVTKDGRIVAIDFAMW